MKQIARYIVMVVMGALFLGAPVCYAVEVKLHVSVVSRKSTDTINDFGFSGDASELAGVDAMQKNPKVSTAVSDGAGDALLPRLPSLAWLIRRVASCQK